MANDGAPAAPSGGGGNGAGGMMQPTPSNFAARVAQNMTSQPQQPQQPVALQPTAQPQAWNQFDKPTADGQNFQNDQQRHLNPGDEQNPQQQQPQDQQQQPQDQQERLNALATKLSEAFQSGLMPEEFLDFMVKVPWGGDGQTREVSARELVPGFMRQSDYTRAKTEIAYREQQLASYERNLNEMFQTFQQPEAMYERLVSLGYRKSLEQVARMVYKRWHEEEITIRGLPEDRRAAYRQQMERTRELEERTAAQERQNRQLAAQAQQRQSEAQRQQNSEYIQNQINQHRPLAFRTLGIPDTPYHRHIFDQQLVAVIRSSGQPFNGQITREQAHAAAQGAREIIEDDVARARQANAPQGQQQGQPLSPNRLAPAANPMGSQRQPVNQRRRPGQFDSDMRQRNGAR